MPLLGGLFSKKNRSPLKHDNYAASNAHSSKELDSALSSPTLTASSYVTPERTIPSYPNASNLLHPDSARERLSHDAHAPGFSSSPPAPTFGGNRLRLFGRKKSATAAQALNVTSVPDISSKAYTTPPRSAQQNRATTDGGGAETDPTDLRRLRPPPSRSAIFAAYGEPNGALSTRSLPTDGFTGSESSLPIQTPSPPMPKRPSLFAWNKQTSSPSTSSPKSPPQESARPFDLTDSPGSPDNSFNLKSFRHIRPPSPPPTNGSNISLSAPIPRPRGASVNSDASQRISVAAFREAQARRSLAGSPSPSFRSPSPVPDVPSSSIPDAHHRPRPARSTPSMPAQRRRSSMAIASTTESDDDSSEEADSEDDRYPGSTHSPLDNRKRPGKPRAKSEAGHGDTSSKRTAPPLPTRAPRSHSGHTFAPAPRPVTQYNLQDEEKKAEVPPRSQSSLGLYGGVRQRASVSTSALSPSAAAKRASVLAASNADLGISLDSRSSLALSKSASPLSRTPPEQVHQQSLQRPPQQPPQQPTMSPPFKGKAASQIGHGNSTFSQADSDSDSEDDAPLATLVGPRRPGSGMSSHSSTYARSSGNVSSRPGMPPKPLIDINELIGPKPKRSFTVPAELDPAAFTQGPTLLSRGQPASYAPGPLVESPKSTSPWHDDEVPLTSTVPPVKFMDPPRSPAKEMRQFIDDTIADSEPKHSLPAPSRRETSPEARRDHITDRLSRAVKLNMPPSVSASPSQAQAPAPPLVPHVANISRDVSPRPSDDSSRSRPTVDIPRVPLPRSPPPPVQFSEGDHSPADADLAALLGSAGIKFISRAGETPEESSESESEQSEDNKSTIAPIPIKQRAPAPAFSVTSRPSFPRQQNGTGSPPPVQKAPSSVTVRPRSTTLVTTSSSNSFATPKASTSNSTMSSYTTDATSMNSTSKSTTVTQSKQANTLMTTTTKTERTSSMRPLPAGQRQRSSTVLTGVPLSSQMPKNFPPDKPFAARRNSPASSTGDSSNSRGPNTPRDGSDIVMQDEQARKKKDTHEWSGGASGLGTTRREHVKRRSVSFEDDAQEMKPPTRSHLREGARFGSEDGHSRSSRESERVEEKRRERRRSEAKAAIELGNVINGPAPVVDDDDDDLPINQSMNVGSRMSAVNPMMAMGSPMGMGMPMSFGGSPMGPGGWGGNMGSMGNMSQSMLSPAQFMAPPPADPSFLMAHQQAMMIAKQAYQMAVAQQAMAAAADEWERGSAIGGYGGGGSVYGGSAYGGSNAPSMMGSPYNMMGMMQQGGRWASAASAYGGGGGGQMFNSSRSEYGGGGRTTGNWSSSKSSYGEAFGPSSDPYARKGGQTPKSQLRSISQPRDSGYFPPVPPLPASQNQNGRSSPDLRSGTRQRTTSQPASQPRGLVTPKKAPPPSSWKQAGV